MMKNTPIIITFGASVLLLFVLGILLFVNLSGEAGAFIVHRNIYGNVDVSGSLAAIVGMVGVIFVMVVMNGLLAYIVYHRERFLAYMFAGAGAVLAMFSTVLCVSILAGN